MRYCGGSSNQERRVVATFLPPPAENRPPPRLADGGSAECNLLRSAQGVSLAVGARAFSAALDDLSLFVPFRGDGLWENKNRHQTVLDCEQVGC